MGGGLSAAVAGYAAAVGRRFGHHCCWVRSIAFGVFRRSLFKLLCVSNVYFAWSHSTRQEIGERERKMGEIGGNGGG